MANSADVRAALDRLETLDIVVPVWDRATVQGRNERYRVVGFARVRLVDYRMPGQNRLTARFFGYATCGEAPHSAADPATTPRASTDAS